ncbi:hypothetical protein [Cyclobacterium salsum]|nr:hypothetical protein [Cyclobacterium salsum]
MIYPLDSTSAVRAYAGQGLLEAQEDITNTTPTIKIINAVFIF